MCVRVRYFFVTERILFGVVAESVLNNVFYAIGRREMDETEKR